MLKSTEVPPLYPTLNFKLRLLGNKDIRRWGVVLFGRRSSLRLKLYILLVKNFFDFRHNFWKVHQLFFQFNVCIDSPKFVNRLFHLSCLDVLNI